MNCLYYLVLLWMSVPLNVFKSRAHTFKMLVSSVCVLKNGAQDGKRRVVRNVYITIYLLPFICLISLKAEVTGNFISM